MSLLLEVTPPSDPAPNVVPETPTVPADPTPTEAPDLPSGPSAPEPHDPGIAEPVGPDVPSPDPKGPETLL
jgi:hypothetical protein